MFGAQSRCKLVLLMYPLKIWDRPRNSCPKSPDGTEHLLPPTFQGKHAEKFIARRLSLWAIPKDMASAFEPFKVGPEAGSPISF